MSPVEVRYDTFARRFLAGIMDGFVMMPLTYFDGKFAPENHGTMMFLCWSGISYFAASIYNVVFHARYGQTIGKMGMKIRVLDLSEERHPSFRQAVLREIGSIVLSAVALIYLVYLVMVQNVKIVPGNEFEASGMFGTVLAASAFGWLLIEIISVWTNSKRRALHDYIAGTVVVHQWSAKKTMKPN